MKLISESKTYLNIALSPSTNPRLCWINLVFTVSIGVTASTASTTPAPIPARNCWPMEKKRHEFLIYTDCIPILSLPFSFARAFLKYEFAPNRMPAFGIDPIKVTPSPLYKERNPVVLVVYTNPPQIPVKGGFCPAGSEPCSVIGVMYHMLAKPFHGNLKLKLRLNRFHRPHCNLLNRFCSLRSVWSIVIFYWISS